MKVNHTEPTDSWVRNGLYTLYFKELDSTNRTASALIDNKMINGPTAIISEYQKSGRGQLQTKWHSMPNKNLTFSLAYPKFNQPIENQFKINKCLSLAVKSAIDSAGITTKIKWPNDIYFENKKLAGLLVENQISGQQISRCVAGIGININQEEWPDVLNNPISLKQIIGSSTDLKKLFDIWIPLIHTNFTELLGKSNSNISNLYNNSLYGRNQWLNFSDNDLQFRGKITEVNALGELIILNEKGITKNYRFKEIEFLFD